MILIKVQIFIIVSFHMIVFCMHPIAKLQDEGLIRAISDVIEKFYVDDSIYFDIIVYRSSHIHIIDEIGAARSHEYLNEIIIIENETFLSDLNLENSALIFTQNVSTLNYFNNFVSLSNKFPKKMKFLVYLSDTQKLVDYIHVLGLYATAGYMIESEYIIYDSDDFVQLLTVEWFTPIKCNTPFISILNTFIKSQMKWEDELTSHEKFRDFLNCTLYSGVMLEIPASFYIDEFSGLENGLIVELFQGMAKYGNFHPRFKTISISILTNPNGRIPNYIQIHKEQKTVHIIHELKSPVIDNGHVTMTFDQGSFVFLITPSKPYSMGEKLFLPFDNVTWMLLIVTFFIAVIVIFTLAFQRQKIKDLVYGDKINTPLLNLLYIFFGMGQIKTPTKTFPRLLLMYFILFCLIFRTCYQDKLFEFMTTDMWTPPPETIKDLHDQNFTIVTIGYDHVLKSLENMIDDKLRYKTIWPTHLRSFTYYVTQGGGSKINF